MAGGGVFPGRLVRGRGQGAPAPATAAVTRQDLSATTPVTATLGYAGSYTVTGQGGGTLTWLPSPGQVIRQGQVLYQTGNGSPVVLLYGSVPDWRALDEGITGAGRVPAQPRPGGPRVRRTARISPRWAGITTRGRRRTRCSGWKSTWGSPARRGSLSLGQVVFEPEALRVSQVTGSLGGPASGPVLAATSDRHVVTIPLDASQRVGGQGG